MYARPQSPESPPEGDVSEKFRVVDFHAHDREHPRNWSSLQKWIQVILLTCLTFMVQYAGSSYSSAQHAIAIDFDTSEELSILGTSSLLLAYAIVPMFLAPLAENFGRRPVYVLGYFLFLCLSIPTAVTTDISIMVIFRFLAGAAGSVGNTMIGGSITDMYEAKELGPPMSVYIIFGLLLSTPAGPLASGFIVDSVLGYHWVFWVQIIVGTPILIILVFGLRETRPSVLLKKHAKELQAKDPDTQFKAAGDDKSLLMTTAAVLKRPWLLMFTDIIVALFSLWLAFAWGVAYGLLQSIALVFKTIHGFTEAQIGLVYISPLIALVVAIFASYLQERYFQAQWKRASKIVPESRLNISCIGSVCLAGGLFFYGWTAQFGLSPYLPITAVGIVFFGIFTVYHSVFLYICDNYSEDASSALSAAGLWRNVIASAFPLFTRQLYRNLPSYGWASSLLGFLGVLIGLAPFLLKIFGKRLRSASKYIET